MKDIGTATENIPRRGFVVGTLGFALAGCTGSGPQEDRMEEQVNGTGRTENAETLARGEPTEAGEEEEGEGEAEDESPPVTESESDGNTTHSLIVRLRHDSGAPVDGEVLLDGPDGRSLYESSNAKVVLEVEPGDYSVSAADFEERIGSEWHDVRVYDDTEFVVTLIEMVVEDVTALAGPDRTTASPGVEITSERRDGATTTKTTDEDGAVVFRLYRGNYRMTAVDESGQEETQSVLVDRPGIVVEFDSFGSYSNLPLRMLTFEVRDYNGSPISGIIMQGRATGISGTSNEGSFDDEVDFETASTDASGIATTQARERHEYDVWGVDAESGEYYDPAYVNTGTQDEITISGDTTVLIYFD